MDSGSYAPLLRDDLLTIDLQNNLSCSRPEFAIQLRWHTKQNLIWDQEQFMSDSGKLDLNNADLRDFMKYRGFYPVLARKIIDYAPYMSVENILNIPGLTDEQKERLQANLDNFTVTGGADAY